MQSQTRKNCLYWYKFINYTVANELLRRIDYIAANELLIFDKPDNLSLTACERPLCVGPLNF